MGVTRQIKVGILTAPHIEFEQRANTFILKNVRIGIGFHWDRYEDQEFAGTLTIRNNGDGTQKPNHEGFDVCADDHCQRYEGLRRMSERAVEAVRATAGQVLLYNDEICDCRYYKCCGGKTEIWRTCWEDIDVPYIQSVQCDYCKSPSPKILRLVLNDYDQETKDFRDWKVTYKDEELNEIIRTKSGIDFGEIIDLIPLHRGASGRIDQLRIVGTKHTEVIGKELKIRYWLSRSCLYSSWFEVAHKNGVWTLSGHGWGHGAGLCQIGAAVMASEGHPYEEILSYYYVGSRLSAPAK